MSMLKYLKSLKTKKFIFSADASLNDKEIKFIIESLPEQKLIRIERNKSGKATAFYLAPDYNTRLKALDKAYRLKGKYNHASN